MTHAFHQLAKGFTGGVDVLKQLAAAAAPAGETLGQQGHILIAPGPQPFDGDLRQTLAVVVDGERVVKRGIRRRTSSSSLLSGRLTANSG